MALALKDRVKETTIVVGTGAATLLGSSIGFQPFSVVGNGNTTYYCISDQFGSNWEVGIGTYSSSGNTLDRTTVLASSNAGALVVFTAGVKDVFVTYPAEKGVWLDSSNNAIGLGTPAAFVGTNITGTASGLTAGNVTTNANLSGAVSSIGNSTSLGSFTSLQLKGALTDETGSGSAVFATSPTLDSPTYTGTLTGSTSILNIGSGQIYKDASGNVGIGTSSPAYKLDVSGSINASGSVNSANTFGFKNRIINGNMAIDQRNAGAAVTPTVDGTYTLDRWKISNTQSSKFSVQQQTSVVSDGFTYALKVTSLSAYSVGSGDSFGVYQVIEGFNVADFSWGTANAKAVTLSFRVYSSLTGTFGGAIVAPSFGFSYPFSYSVTSANTWTTISVAIAGPTSGTFGSTNGNGFSVFFGLGSGATYSGTAGAWVSSTALTATGAVSVVGTSGATFYITGVQLEKGSTATSFDQRAYSQELAMCQRYFTNLVIPNGCIVGPTGMNQGPSFSWFPILSSFRATPSITYSGTLNVIQGNTPATVTSISTVYNTQFGISLGIACSGAAFSTGYAVSLYANGSTSYLNISAEL